MRPRDKAIGAGVIAMSDAEVAAYLAIAATIPRTVSRLAAAPEGVGLMALRRVDFIHRPSKHAKGKRGGRARA